MAVLKQTAIDVLQYPDAAEFVCPGMGGLTVSGSPDDAFVFAAFEQDVWIEEVVAAFRAGTFPSPTGGETATVQLYRFSAGGGGATAFGAATTFTAAPSAAPVQYSLDIYDLSSEIANPRLLKAGELLGVRLTEDAAVGSWTAAPFTYIRYRTKES